MISILILTLNEELNLPGCLESVAWSDDIVVLDSFSTDRTVEIAQTAGARVVQRKSDDWANHQNWAVQNIPFQYPWVYYSDADERVTPDLAAELQSIASDRGRAEVAYRVRFRNIFMGRWVKYSSLYPTWVLRFFRPGCVRWQRLVNPVPIVDGAKLPCTVFQFSRGGLDARRATVLDYFIAGGHRYKNLSLLRSSAWRLFATVDDIAQVQIVAVGQTLTADSAARTVSGFAVDSAAPMAELFEEIEKDRAGREVRDPPQEQ